MTKEKRTEEQIVLETLQEYALHPERRSVILSPAAHHEIPVFNHPEGKTCSVGRCLDPEKRKEIIEGIGTTEDFTPMSEILKMRKPEYRKVGSIWFWSKIQDLHDTTLAPDKFTPEDACSKSWAKLSVNTFIEDFPKAVEFCLAQQTNKQ